MAGREPDARDVAPEVHGAREPGEHVAAEVVDGAGPKRFFQRALAEVELLPEQHAARTELTEIRLSLAFAAQCHDFVTAPGEHVDREAADAARGAGDDDRPATRDLPVLLHAVYGQCRGEAGRAELHRRERVDACGQRNHPVALHPGVFGIATIVGFTQPAAGDDHLVAGSAARVARLHDFARKIDTAHERESPQDLPGTGGREGVLVVDGGVVHADDDVTGREIVQREFLETRLDA